MTIKTKKKTKSSRPKRQSKKTPRSTLKQNFPIIGIGASAGGLEAYTELFRLLPPDTGMAFVLVQHLSPQHLSLLSEIVQKTTRMGVQEVKDGTTILPNNVYVIPPNSILEVFHGVLHLREMLKPHATNRLVDTFFRSLAHDHRNLAVGVVLSGTGSDGSQGLRDIKAEGGLSFVQDPESAKFDGMPRMAIELDHPDHVLPIKGLVKELVKVAAQPHTAKILSIETRSLTSDNERYLKQIFLLIRSATGTDFSTYKTPTILRRIKRRMVLHRIESLKNYHAFLESSKAETKALFSDLLINVTEFFRNPDVFESLKSKAFPKLLKKRPAGEAIRLWVPGCSTGEEVYSLAIALLEFLGPDAGKYPIQIYGTDIGENIIARARAGVFSDAIAKQVSDTRLANFFVKEKNGYKVAPRVRECCIFSVQDVTSDPPIHRLDMLSCRNLMIYLSVATQKQLMENFFYALKPNGFLLLGASESVGTAASLFAIVDDNSKLYLKRGTAAPPRRERMLARAVAAGQVGAPLKSKINPPLDEMQADPISIAEKMVLENHAPAWLLINQAMDIVQFKGNTGPFINHRSGQPSWNLFRMLREDLLTEVRVLLHSSQKGHVPVRKVDLEFKTDAETRLLDIEVYPIASDGIDPHFLVLFIVRPAQAQQVGTEPRTENAEITKLRENLAEAQNSLRSFLEDQNSTNEELQSANEEILSANEELQSTNEELETAKEELQSTNEELVTLNEELSVKNMELRETNSDLVNVLSNSQSAIVIVDGAFQIRRLTPSACRLLRVETTDIGRKLMSFNLGFPMDLLEEKFGEVIQNVSTVEFEARSRDGNFYSIRMRPYKTTDNRIDGAVATFIDIDDLKKKQHNIQATQQYSTAIIDTVHDSLIVLNKALQVERVNRAFYQTFRTTEAETIGESFFELGDAQWNSPRLKDLLEELLTVKIEIKDFEFTQDFKTIGKKKMLINGQRLEWEQQKQMRILLAIREIYEPK